ncbi:MAG: GatB/YqeY domain-containing protein [Agitococcus sp.]|nr:GatB/YqeY domain-containing protein [Agitococcus sp.]MDO9178623.1 GatB/YqeY domain-containing protein [Agitococcus sp.]
MLLKQIQDAALSARKARDTVRATLLVTVFAEAARIGKDAGNRESTDDEVLKTLKKFVTGVEETMAQLEQLVANATDVQRAQAVLTRDTRTAELTLERIILAEFLPVPTSTAELTAFIEEKVALLPEKTPKQMGVLMKLLKERFGVNYDATLASILVKAALAA